MSARFGPDALLDCYRRGVFPMAEDRDADRLFLVDPAERGVIPIQGFHVPSRLARTVRKEPYRVTIDRDFAAVMAACAEPTPERPDTWINADIVRLYSALHRQGNAHSVECWRDGEGVPQLVGGLYGVSLGAAFFGESMFSRAEDASKIALVYLVARLRVGGFRLLDAQFHTAHLAQFGTSIVPRPQFKAMLAEALALNADFARMPETASGVQVLQSIAQTS